MKSTLFSTLAGASVGTVIGLSSLKTKNAFDLIYHYRGESRGKVAKVVSWEEI